MRLGIGSLNLILVLVCVLAISTGQLLFKQVGLAIEASRSWFGKDVLLYAASAFALYAAATVLWIHLLRFVALSRAYPFMAITFVIVPLASAWLFGDRLSAPYFVGVLLIGAGIVVITCTG
jgi:drug/metabolite transporter (DMT)-like permease